MEIHLVHYLLGLLTASLVEYVHHRWAGHTRFFGTKIFSEHHYHHGDPQEGGVQFLTKVRTRFPLVTILLGLIACGFACVLSRGETLWVLCGSLSGYLYLEWFHHRMHHSAPRNAITRWLWRYHYTHHFTSSRYNFGFTTPLWDLVFRTYRRPEVCRIPAGKAPLAIGEIRGFFD